MLRENSEEESKELPGKQDIIVIRQPKTVEKVDFHRFVKELSRHDFFPVVLQPDAEESYYFSSYPTDKFREVGSKIFAIDTDYLDQIIQRAAGLPANTVRQIKERVVDTTNYLSGHSYVYSDLYKLFIYAPNTDFDEIHDFYMRDKKRRVDHILHTLKSNDWKVIPVKIDDIRLQGSTLKKHDLDFLISSPFQGKDGRPHVITAESFSQRVPDNLTVDSIPDEEALLGGCNIGDVRRGTVLIPPNKIETPTTNAILSQFATALIIQAPKKFLNGGGGPRCQISSFSIVFRRNY